MRFAELAGRAGLIVALGLAASSCAFLPGARPAAQSPAATAPAVQPAAPAVAETNTKAAAAVAPPLPEIPSAARRAFDEATRALAAGRVDEAERGFLALARSNPELGGPHANLGLIYRRAGKLEQAVAQLEQAVQASPEQPVYLNQLGIAYRESGRFADAQQAYEKAIALAPGYASPHLNLGILLDLYLWDSRGALAAYERYLTLAPDGDEKVRRWVAEIKNRKPQPQLVGMRERP
jgi:Flp pilus assembly protein TadD